MKWLCDTTLISTRMLAHSTWLAIPSSIALTITLTNSLILPRSYCFLVRRWECNWPIPEESENPHSDRIIAGHPSRRSLKIVALCWSWALWERTCWMLHSSSLLFLCCLCFWLNDGCESRDRFRRARRGTDDKWVWLLRCQHFSLWVILTDVP